MGLETTNQSALFQHSYTNKFANDQSNILLPIFTTKQVFFTATLNSLDDSFFTDTEDLLLMFLGILKTIF